MSTVSKCFTVNKKIFFGKKWMRANFWHSNLNERYAEVCNFIKKETLAQVFSCEFFEISKNTFSYRIPPVAASHLANYINIYILLKISDVPSTIMDLKFLKFLEGTTTWSVTMRLQTVNI